MSIIIDNQWYNISIPSYYICLPPLIYGRRNHLFFLFLREGHCVQYYLRVYTIHIYACVCIHNTSYLLIGQLSKNRQKILWQTRVVSIVIDCYQFIVVISRARTKHAGAWKRFRWSRSRIFSPGHLLNAR